MELKKPLILHSPDYVEPTWYMERLSDEKWQKCYEEGY